LTEYTNYSGGYLIVGGHLFAGGHLPYQRKSELSYQRVHAVAGSDVVLPARPFPVSVLGGKRCFLISLSYINLGGCLYITCEY
jgi:hypothetical protein